MRWSIGLLAQFFLVFGANALQSAGAQERVLFIGNSITYTGNLPAVFDALSARNGHPSSSDMIVAPGATLTDMRKGSTVARALHRADYAFVVLQERGGDLMGNFGPKATKYSIRSITALVEETRRQGATPILLGTYQMVPEDSKQIEETEGNAARALGIAYVPVSERLRSASASQSKLAWFAPDGMHPGADLTLMYAVLIYEALYKQSPVAEGFSVEAPIYAANSGLKPELRAAASPAPRGDTPFGTTYGSTRVAAVEIASR